MSGTDAENQQSVAETANQQSAAEAGDKQQLAESAANQQSAAEANEKELLSTPQIERILNQVEEVMQKNKEQSASPAADQSGAVTNVEKPTPKQIVEAEKAVEEAQRALDASPEDEGLKTALKTAQDKLADLKSKAGGRRRTKRKQQKKGKSAKKGGKKHRKSSGKKSRRSSSKKSRRQGRK